MARAYRTEAQLSFQGDGCPAVVNHARETDVRARVRHRRAGRGRASTDGPLVMASDDMSLFLQRAPGLLLPRRHLADARPPASASRARIRDERGWPAGRPASGPVRDAERAWRLSPARRGPGPWPTPSTTSSSSAAAWRAPASARDLALRGLSVALVEKGDFASATTVALLQAHPRRPALPRAVRLRARARVAPRARDARATGASPRAAAAVPGADLRRLLARPHQGPHRPQALRLAHAGPDRERYRVLKAVDALSLEPGIRRRGSARRRLLLRRSAALPGAALPRERAVGVPPRRARVQLRAGGGGRARRGGHAQRRARARSAHGPVATLGAAGHRQRDRPLGGRAARAGRRAPSAARAILRRTKGIHCLLPRLTDRAIYHSTARRPDDLRDPVARVLAGGHDRHRFRRRSRPPARHRATRSTTCSARCARRCPTRASPRARSSTPTRACGRSPSRKGKRESDVSRAHKVVEEAGGRFLSITGTKLTCFRSLAEELGDRVTRALGRGTPSRTAQLTLDGVDEEARRVEAHTWLDVSDDARGQRTRSGDARVAGDALRSQLPSGDGAGRQGPGRNRAPVPVEPRHGGAAVTTR